MESDSTRILTFWKYSAHPTELLYFFSRVLKRLTSATMLKRPGEVSFPIKNVLSSLSSMAPGARHTQYYEKVRFFAPYLESALRRYIPRNTALKSNPIETAFRVSREYTE
jgi:hypothetical protein